MSQALLFTSLSLPNTERVLFICLRLSAAAASLPFSRSLALPMRLYGCACVCRFRWLLSGSPALFLLFFLLVFRSVSSAKRKRTPREGSRKIVPEYSLLYLFIVLVLFGFNMLTKRA